MMDNYPTIRLTERQARSAADAGPPGTVPPERISVEASLSFALEKGRGETRAGDWTCKLVGIVPLQDLGCC